MSETEKKQAQAAKKMEAAKATQQKPGTIVYIGPDIPGVKQHTVFNNGLPEALKERIREQPLFKSFAIPVERLAQASIELEREGSALHTLFQKANKGK